MDLRIEQGLMQIQALLDYVGSQMRVGLVMLISLRHLQVEAGVSFDLLEQPTTTLLYLTDCWLLSVRRFCAKFHISLSVRRNRVPQLSREHDSMLMEKAITLGFTRQELIDINLVRIYLCATTVSDVTTADGKHIHPFSWKGLPIPDRSSVTSFARQEKPTSNQCGLWRRLLRSLLRSTATVSDLALHQPLGSWTAESTMRWVAMLWNSTLYRSDPSIQRGDAQDERHISVHFPRRLVTSHSTSTYYDATPDWYTATIPARATPADITGDQVFMVTTARYKSACIPAAGKSFSEWIRQLPMAEQRLIDNHYFEDCDAEQTLVQYLQLKCTLIIGTDGGKREHQGSFSWILCSPGEEKLVFNAGPVDG